MPSEALFDVDTARGHVTQIRYFITRNIFSEAALSYPKIGTCPSFRVFSEKDEIFTSVARLFQASFSAHLSRGPSAIFFSLPRIGQSVYFVVIAGQRHATRSVHTIEIRIPTFRWRKRGATVRETC